MSLRSLTHLFDKVNPTFSCVVLLYILLMTSTTNSIRTGEKTCTSYDMRDKYVCEKGRQEEEGDQ